jgi:hypothetical protein
MKDTEQPEIMNYDPNLARDMAKQTVRLTFGVWRYRTAIEVLVGGNCLGHRVIECAVGSAYEDLPTKTYRDGKKKVKAAFIDLKAPNGDIIQCEDDDNKEEDWLKDMLISAEIVSITPDPESE